MKYYLKFSFFIVFIFTSCSRIHFDADLPEAATSIKSFDLNMKGQYELVDSIIKLKNDLYYNSHYFENYSKTKDSCVLISATMTILENELFYNIIVKSYYKIDRIDIVSTIKKHKKETINCEGDYLIFENQSSDTLLNLKKGDKIKVYKEKYYLNHFIEKDDWEVYQLEIIKDHLLSFNLLDNEDEKMLETSIKEYEIFGNIVHLSDEQFDNFVEKGGFRRKFRFKKVRSK